MNIICLFTCLKTKRFTTGTAKHWRTLPREVVQSTSWRVSGCDWTNPWATWSEFSANLTLSKRLGEMVFWDSTHLKYSMIRCCHCSWIIWKLQNWKGDILEPYSRSTLFAGSPVYACRTKDLHIPWALCFCVAHPSGKKLYNITQDLCLGLATC